MWVRVLTTKYGKLNEEAGRIQGLKSVVWRGMLHGYELLKKGLKNSAGNGRAAEFGGKHQRKGISPQVSTCFALGWGEGESV